MLLPTSCRKHTRLLALQQAGQHITESRALLYRIARNLVIDRYRRGRYKAGPQIITHWKIFLHNVPVNRMHWLHHPRFYKRY
ncbi:MAG: ECF subfamily RNA polymerase sigma-70 factor [Nitrosomonas europaea]|nr:MAG: ECF subfamily RNA polymerase sigma-70 factor [Nitrosomonas europaea]